MKRLCVLGNSHIAAFATAFEETPSRWSELKLEMFGAHGDSLSHFDVVEGRLQSEDEEARKRLVHLTGRDSIVLSDYDGFVITGLQVAIFTFVRMFRELSSLAMPSVEDAMTALDDGRPLASGALLRAYGAERLLRTPGMVMAQKLRAATDAPIFIASQPRPSGRVREMGATYLGFTQLAARGDGVFVSEWYDRMMAELSEGLGLRYIPQPVTTIEAEGLFTRESYLRGSMRLAKRKGLAHEGDDVLHANADFARLMIDQVAYALNLPITV